MASPDDTRHMLKECGSLATLAGLPRRHVLTFSDTHAPGEATGLTLPRRIRATQATAFRIPVGPALAEAEVRLEVEGQIGELRVNGEVCAPVLRPMPSPVVAKPSPNRPFSAWRIPQPVAGSVVIDARPATFTSAPAPSKISWSTTCPWPRMRASRRPSVFAGCRAES